GQNRTADVSPITLSSESEGLLAWGNELTYDRGSGQTVLKGDAKNEMVADKDGSRIHAPELVLTGVAVGSPQPADKSKLQALARGPGYILMDPVDKTPAARPGDPNRAFTKKVSWQGQLHVVREGHAPRTRDVITLTGDAVFEDLVNRQYLRADTI